MSKPAGTIRSPRAAARRDVMRTLNGLRDQIKALRAWWDCSTTVYIAPADRKPGENVWTRPRELSEYPEAQRRYWASTMTEIDDMIAKLIKLREHCINEYHATPVSGAAQAAEQYRKAEG